MHRSSFLRAATPAALVLLAASVLAAPAHAQLGGLRRAVERRVEQKAEDRTQAAMLVEPTFDNTTIEITAERLDRYQAAMERMKAQRAANRQRYDQMQVQRNALADSSRMVKNDREESAYGRATDTWDQCASHAREERDKAAEAQSQAMVARFQSNPMGAQNDPKVKQMMAAMQEMAAAQQRGDAAAVQRIQERIANLMGATTDSNVVNREIRTKCGPKPAKPASMVRADAYAAKGDSVDKASQALLQSATPKGADVGMTDVQARMMWERIASWLVGMRQDAPITRTFSKGEYDLLVERRGALKKAFAGSE